MYTKNKQGFSLIELMVAMTVFIMAMVASSNIFMNLFTKFKQQSKIAEGGMESQIGQGILRNDISQAGDGLFWVGTYVSEAIDDGSAYNDTGGAPRAVVSGDGLGAGVAGSDVLVIRALNATSNNAAQKWTYLRDTGVRNWSSLEDLNSSDFVVVIDPGVNLGNNRTLLSMTTFGSVLASSPSGNLPYNIVYGLDESAARMPFNRADYYVSMTDVPSQCASGTGVLVKGEISQEDGSRVEMPLIDCVADMQVVYARDSNRDGTIDFYLDDLGVLNAEQIRNELKEVRLYYLSHEGQRDATYTHPSATVDVGETLPRGVGAAPFYGRSSFDISGGDWPNYRWKLQALIVKTDNLM